MPTTPRLGIPYPAPTDRPSVSQLKQLAEATEDALNADEGRVYIPEGPRWGVAYNPSTHRKAVYARTIVAVPNSFGNINIVYLDTLFAGVASFQLTIGFVPNAARFVAGDTNGSLLYAQIRNQAGSIVTSGNHRVEVLVHGWTVA